MDPKRFHGLSLDMLSEYKIFQAYRNDTKESASSNFHLSSKYKSNTKTGARLVNSSDKRHSCSHATETCLDVHQSVLKNLDSSQQHVSNIKKLLQKRKKHTFGSSDQLDNKIEALLAKCRSMMADAETQVSETLNLHSINAGSRLKALVVNMRCSLSGKVGQAAKELQEIERMYVKLKNVSLAEEQGQKSEFNFINELSTDDRTQVLYDDTGNSLIMAEIEEAELSHELRAIFRNIDSMGKLLQDMSVLAVTQGTLIDRIDINIVSTLETAQKANHELLASRDMLKNDLTTRCTKWLIMLNLLVFGLLLIKHLL